MNGFSNIAPAGLSSAQIERIGRRDVLPTSVKSRFLPQDILGNSVTSTGSFSFADGVVVTITARTTSDLDPEIKIGMLPFMIALYDSDTFSGITPGTNQIPFDVTTGDFDVYGPMAMPDYLVNGKRFYVTSGGSNIYFATDGNDVVYKTAIRNSSGGAETVQYLIQTRVLQSRGGGRSIT
jgi:hypothetical protein